VLAAPFALGLASSSSLAKFRQSVGNGTPTCVNCVVSTQIQKLQTITDMGCSYFTQGEDPYLEETAYCQRYACSNGYYYTFSGWSPTNVCLANPLTATPCPTGSCTPIN
jgi:hypothetical protein